MYPLFDELIEEQRRKDRMAYADEMRKQALISPKRTFGICCCLTGQAGVLAGDGGLPAAGALRGGQRLESGGLRANREPYPELYFIAETANIFSPNQSKTPA